MGWAIALLSPSAGILITPRIRMPRMPARSLRKCETSRGQKHATIMLHQNFPMFLSEMGQQSGNIEHTLALRTRIICAAQKIFFIERRLVPAILCCVHLDAAMHNRKSDMTRKFDSGLKQAQHQTLISSMRVRSRFEQHCSLKTG
jgi:hypothetical protein